MDHLTTTITINIDPLFKHCLKCYAAENHTTISDLVRQYLLEGFTDNEWRSEYEIFSQQRFGEEHPELVQLDMDEVNRIIKMFEKQKESEKQQ